ncbi:hypothetical protein LINPERPRIM_LOCUS27393 [Linum perenne]
MVTLNRTSGDVEISSKKQTSPSFTEFSFTNFVQPSPNLTYL